MIGHLTCCSLSVDARNRTLSPSINTSPPVTQTSTHPSPTPTVSNPEPLKLRVSAPPVLNMSKMLSWAAFLLCATAPNVHGAAAAIPASEKTYPDVIPGPGLPSLASLGLTSPQLYTSEHSRPTTNQSNPRLTALSSLQ